MRRTLITGLVVVSLSTAQGCTHFKKNLTQELEAEKSFTRYAMEHHRQHPNQRNGDDVLETWSTADYIAVATAQQKLPSNWASPSDRLPFLQNELRLDSSDRPFCVILNAGNIVVLRLLAETPLDCRLNAAEQINISRIRSGDMDFSGRSDFWVYVLRQASGP